MVDAGPDPLYEEKKSYPPLPSPWDTQILFCDKNTLLQRGSVYRASDFFQDCRAEVTNGAKNGGSFSEMMGPSISN